MHIDGSLSTSGKTMGNGDANLFNASGELRNSQYVRQDIVPDIILDWRLLCDDETAPSDVDNFETRTFRNSTDEQSEFGCQLSTASFTENDGVRFA